MNKCIMYVCETTLVRTSWTVRTHRRLRDCCTLCNRRPQSVFSYLTTANIDRRSQEAGLDMDGRHRNKRSVLQRRVHTTRIFMSMGDHKPRRRRPEISSEVALLPSTNNALAANLTPLTMSLRSVKIPLIQQLAKIHQSGRAFT